MNNKVYIYNNNFLSLLGLIIILIRKKIVPDLIKNYDYQESLFDEVIYLDIPEVNNTINYVINKIGIDNYNIIYKVFLSNEENKELIIFYYFLNSLKYQNKTIYMKNIKWVVDALRISNHVTHEAHKFKGFTRFKELKSNVLYAEVNPDNDILYLLSLHFKSRLKNEYFIIKDVNRNIYSIYDKKDFYLISGDNFAPIVDKFSKFENKYNEMWKEFYKTIGIEARRNDKCRMNFMPKKYWQYITEVENEKSN